MNTKYLEKICRMSQIKLKRYLVRHMKGNVVNASDYIYHKGTVPILLVAHLDTVHEQTPKVIMYDKSNQMSSPQGIGGDDRCGVYAILEIIKKYDCHVLFTKDEEIGGVGAAQFVDDYQSLDIQYIIELDRKGKNDAVFYDCDNPEFNDFILKGDDWKYAEGSFSDISIIAPELGVAAVNLSCGYHKAHTKDEYINLTELDECIEKVCQIIERTTDKDKFEYIEMKSLYKGYYGYDMYNERFNNIYVIYANDYSIEAEVSACSDFEAIGMFMCDYPNLTCGDIDEVVNLGEDLFEM